MTVAEAMSLFDLEVGAGAGAACDAGADAALTSGSARRNDPATAHAAAESIAPVLHVELRRVLAVVEAAGEHGATAGEITAALAAAGIDRQRNCTARRVRDLVDAGAVRNSGQVRRLDRKGARDEIVWVRR